MTSLRHSFVAIILLSASHAWAQTPPPAVTRAMQWVEKNPGIERHVALAEIRRAQGDKQAGIDELQKAIAKLPADDPRAAKTQELLCWRMLPVAPSQREAFRQHVAKLKELQQTNPWVPVWELYLLTGDSNRAALLAAIAKMPTTMPARFPSAAAETAHLGLLKELGQGRVQAGVDVIAARSYDALHALRDLDRALTREADFLSGSQRVEDAKQILDVRDRYRHAYVKASRHLVEKLFALHLTGDDKARDALLAKAKAIPYLHDHRHLSSLLQRLDEEQAWTLVIEPLLASEVALIDNPPNLTDLQARSVTDLHITAQRKTVQGKTVHYEGAVRFRLHAFDLTCDQLTLLPSDDPASVILTGDGKVQLAGLNSYPGGIVANRFSYHAETGSFSLGGDIRLKTHDKTVKLRTCTLTQRGEVRDPRSWLDDFRNAFSMDVKLELLPKITRVYDDTELPDEVRFVLALHTLRPHLNWRAPYLPPLPDRTRKQVEELVKSGAHDRGYDTAWQAALGGEAWMLADITPATEAAFRDSLRAWYKQFNDARRDLPAVLPDLPIPSKEFYFWRLRDPQHPDVARAIRLLQGIGADDLRGKAYHWIEELRRNNTVLTFDIAGAAPLGKAHSVLMDVRNAESVTFKLYRVQRPEELQFAAKNIGKDFLYRDHFLDDDLLAKRESVKDYWEAKGGLRLTEMQYKPGRELEVTWKKEQLVRQWDVRVAELAHHSSDHERRYSRRWHDDRWSNEADADYFDDECSRHRERIDKTYRPHNHRHALSSWQCDRIVRIPEKLLAEAGAYVLVAEANGQTAHVPIVVEPVSLTMRRCRDGVFALVTDANGQTPLVGAKVLAAPSKRWQKEEREDALTDQEGVAFARILAYGDQPLIVHHEGRYAIGGFGQVFEGIYESADAEYYRRGHDRRDRAKRGESKDRGASVYADRHVVIAYTDRPTYRPGQEVQFKLIVRKLELTAPGADAARLAKTFRGAEFDARTKMVLPKLSEAVAYTVLDPKGREVAHGSLTLSEFGTAAGKVDLNEESVVGSYTLRVRIAGEPRLVPEVFAVKHYRRPNFEVQMTGVPELLGGRETLSLSVSGQYYFGPPVTSGTIEVRVLRKNGGKAIVEEHAKLDDKGKAKIELRLPRALDAGKYFVVCSITDDSGRTVSTTAPMALEGPDLPKGTSGLSALPRFIAVNQELKVASPAKEIRVRQDLTDLRYTVKDGAALLKFARPGWYHLHAGDESVSLFVYGGKDHPLDQPGTKEMDEDHDPRLPGPKWVNLSDFGHEDDREVSRWENPGQHLFALFDQQTLKAGDKLRLLVYVPQKRAKLLFTIEGRTILDYAVVWSKAAGGAYQVVEIPIKDRYFPNVYVQGRILALEGMRTPLEELRKEAKADRKADDRHDEDAGVDPRWCRIDVVKPASNIDGDLKVQIDTDRASYRPGDTVRATVRVTDRDGKPQSAELSLAAIDESVYVFGEDNLDSLPSFFRTPHETRRFLPKVWRTTVGSRWSRQGLDSAKKGEAKESAKAMDQMIKQMRAIEAMADLKSASSELRQQHFTLAPLARLGGELPSGEIPLTKLREHFHETATWLPQLYTDDKGIAQASFTLPDSLTRYRLTSVALTKTTEVGVGRARITAGLPLAVQVFLPRFGVEKDRMLAAALVHNNTNQEREIQIAWQIEGAVADVPNPAPLDWKLVKDKGTYLGTGRVKVPANGSAKVGVWLNLEQIGTARIFFRASAGKEADAEVRTLPVQPIGRPAEVNANEELAVVPLKKVAEKAIAGKFHREGSVQLPAGFLARELHISLAASDLAQALDGLDYLIDYPIGCIEQTMSRFLPVVMIKHATQHSPVALQPEIARKLPDILAKGLTRVYGYQHADGSWGWFEKDSQNLPMSVYVVYGLARCQATGTKVDAQILRRGCEYLQAELATNKHEPDLVARAWYALALAGHADPMAFETHVRKALKESPGSTAEFNLALACKEMGCAELGERLWTRGNRYMQGNRVESWALRLNAQIAYGAPFEECQTTARHILARRSGTRWGHTRDTSWAIESLSNMLGYIPDKAFVRKVEVTLAGKTILEVKDANELKKLVYRVRLSAEQLPAKEALEIRMKVDSDEPIYIAVRAVGVQRQDEIQATGTRVKMQRLIETLEGEPVRGPLKVGQVVRVRLRLQLEQHENYLMIEERRASLCEFADEAIAGPSARHAVHQEFRDDRLCVFFTSLSEGTHEIVYYLRAETPGQCSVLPGCAYPMYDEKARGETAASKVEVQVR